MVALRIREAFQRLFMPARMFLGRHYAHAMHAVEMAQQRAWDIKMAMERHWFEAMRRAQHMMRLARMSGNPDLLRAAERAQAITNKANEKLQHAKQDLEKREAELKSKVKSAEHRIQGARTSFEKFMKDKNSESLHKIENSRLKALKNEQAIEKKMLIAEKHAAELELKAKNGDKAAIEALQRARDSLNALKKSRAEAEKKLKAKEESMLKEFEKAKKDVSKHLKGVQDNVGAELKQQADEAHRILHHRLAEVKKQYNHIKKSYEDTQKDVESLIHQKKKELEEHAHNIKKEIHEKRMKDAKHAEDMDTVLNPNKLMKHLEESVFAPIQTPLGTINVKLSKLKENLREAYVTGLDSVPLPTTRGPVGMPFGVVAVAVKEGDKKVREKAEGKIEEILLEGKDVNSKVDGMLNVMFKKLFSADSKIAESKSVQHAEADIVLRNKAIAANGATSTTAPSSFSLWTYLLGK